MMLPTMGKPTRAKALRRALFFRPVGARVFIRRMPLELTDAELATAATAGPAARERIGERPARRFI
jgi:hypothetical protein